MSAVVRLQGLPWETTEEDIRNFFSKLPSLQIVLCEDLPGRPSGRAIVRFRDAASARKALENDKKLIGQRYVDVFKCTEEELERTVRNKTAKAMNMESDTILRLRGIPFSATAADICDFFRGFGVKASDVTFGYLASGPRAGAPSGEAWVQFASHDISQSARQAKHGQKLRDRYIELFHSTKADRAYAQAKELSKPTLGCDDSSVHGSLSTASSNIVVKRCTSGVQTNQSRPMNLVAVKPKKKGTDLTVSVEKLSDDALPYVVQAGERMSEEWQAHWHLHCRCFGHNGYMDPFRYEQKMLRDFLGDTVPYFEHLHWLRSAFTLQGSGDLEHSGKVKSDAHKAMTAEIKERQRNDTEFKRLWVEHCQVHGCGKRDPMQHSEAFLRRFLEEVKLELGENLAKPSSRKHRLNPRKQTSTVEAASAEDEEGHSTPAGHGVVPSAGDDVCPVCLCQPDDPMITTCRHIFCSACILEWAAKRKQSYEKLGRVLELLECPMCNTGLKRSDVQKLSTDAAPGSQPCPRNDHPDSTVAGPNPSAKDAAQNSKRG